MSYNDKITDPPGRHTNSKCVYNKHQNFKIYKAKLIKLRQEIDKSTNTLEDFNSSSWKTRQKIRKVTEDLNNTISHQDLTSLKNTTPNSSKHMWLISSSGMFTNIDHIMGQITDLNTFKETNNATECILRPR